MAQTSIDEVKPRLDLLNDGESDYYGLYEVVWSLNHQYPDIQKKAKVETAQKIVVDLLEKGKISLFHTEWASDNYVPIQIEEGLNLLKDPKTWDDPSVGRYICFITL